MNKIGLRLEIYLNEYGLNSISLIQAGKIRITADRVLSWDTSISAPEPTIEQLASYTEDEISQFIINEKNKNKTLQQRGYENAFFALTEDVLHITSDPRAGQTPPIKLGFQDIQTLIEDIQIVDPMHAVNLSLKLLTIDSALKRYNGLWWDNATTHEML